MLVHGTEEAPVATLATGLALASHEAFAWADCARSGASPSAASHRIFARGAERPGVERVDERMLRASAWNASALDGVLLASSEPERLLRFLQLPELFQKLAARATGADGRSAVLLANVNALGPVERLLSQDRLHRSLHRAGVSLFATAVEEEPVARASSFDRSFRVEVPAGEPWTRGTLTVEKGPPPSTSLAALNLREAWSLLKLDPSLLPRV